MSNDNKNAVVSSDPFNYNFHNKQRFSIPDQGDLNLNQHPGFLNKGIHSSIPIQPYNNLNVRNFQMHNSEVSHVLNHTSTVIDAPEIESSNSNTFFQSHKNQNAAIDFANFSNPPSNSLADNGKDMIDYRSSDKYSALDIDFNQHTNSSKFGKPLREEYYQEPLFSDQGENSLKTKGNAKYSSVQLSDIPSLHTAQSKVPNQPSFILNPSLNNAHEDVHSSNSSFNNVNSLQNVLINSSSQYSCLSENPNIQLHPQVHLSDHTLSSGSNSALFYAEDKQHNGNPFYSRGIILENAPTNTTSSLFQNSPPQSYNAYNAPSLNLLEKQQRLSIQKYNQRAKNDLKSFYSPFERNNRLSDYNLNDDPDRNNILSYGYNLGFTNTVNNTSNLFLNKPSNNNVMVPTSDQHLYSQCQSDSAHNILQPKKSTHHINNNKSILDNHRHLNQEHDQIHQDDTYNVENKLFFNNPSKKQLSIIPGSIPLTGQGNDVLNAQDSSYDSQAAQLRFSKLNEGFNSIDSSELSANHKPNLHKHDVSLFTSAHNSRARYLESMRNVISDNPSTLSVNNENLSKVLVQGSSLPSLSVNKSNLHLLNDKSALLSNPENIQYDLNGAQTYNNQSSNAASRSNNINIRDMPLNTVTGDGQGSSNFEENSGATIIHDKSKSDISNLGNLNQNIQTNRQRKYLDVYNIYPNTLDEFSHQKDQIFDSNSYNLNIQNNNEIYNNGGNILDAQSHSEVNINVANLDTITNLAYKNDPTIPSLNFENIQDTALSSLGFEPDLNSPSTVINVSSGDTRHRSYESSAVLDNFQSAGISQEPEYLQGANYNNHVFNQQNSQNDHRHASISFLQNPPLDHSSLPESNMTFNTFPEAQLNGRTGVLLHNDFYQNSAQTFQKPINVSSLNVFAGNFQLYKAQKKERHRLILQGRKKLIENKGSGFCSTNILTFGLVDFYRSINPNFKYKVDQRPKRSLTKPSDGVLNDGFDNINSDYILNVDESIIGPDGTDYIILESLGSGTFGQVVKCQKATTGEFFAVKVVKNKPAFFEQSMMEVHVLTELKQKWDVENKHHFMRLKEHFIFRNHLCIVNELLSINLYELLKKNSYKGLSTTLIRVLATQILGSMCVLKKAKIIHCDLKPENILLERPDQPSIKVIDFGSACYEGQTIYTYIQSRFYRSPEVLTGLPYSLPIDMWSIGCIIAELFLGLPIFPGTSEFNQISRIVELLGVPPVDILETAQRKTYFFKRIGSNKWRIKTLEEFSKETGTNESPGKKYFPANNLYDLITQHPHKSNMPVADLEIENSNRIVLVDFLRGLLDLNPKTRFTPEQAMVHPFITHDYTSFYSSWQDANQNFAKPPSPSGGPSSSIYSTNTNLAQQSMGTNLNSQNQNQNQSSFYNVNGHNNSFAYGKSNSNSLAGTEKSHLLVEKGAPTYEMPHKKTIESLKNVESAPVLSSLQSFHKSDTLYPANRYGNIGDRVATHSNIKTGNQNSHFSGEIMTLGKSFDPLANELDYIAFKPGASEKSLEIEPQNGKMFYQSSGLKYRNPLGYRYDSEGDSMQPKDRGFLLSNKKKDHGTLINAALRKPWVDSPPKSKLLDLSSAHKTQNFTPPIAISFTTSDNSPALNEPSFLEQIDYRYNLNNITRTSSFDHSTNESGSHSNADNNLYFLDTPNLHLKSSQNKFSINSKVQGRTYSPLEVASLTNNHTFANMDKIPAENTISTSSSVQPNFSNPDGSIYYNLTDSENLVVNVERLSKKSLTDFQSFNPRNFSNSESHYSDSNNKRFTTNLFGQACSDIDAKITTNSSSTGASSGFSAHLANNKPFSNREVESNFANPTTMIDYYTDYSTSSGEGCSNFSQKLNTSHPSTSKSTNYYKSRILETGCVTNSTNNQCFPWEFSFSRNLQDNSNTSTSFSEPKFINRKKRPSTKKTKAKSPVLPLVFADQNNNNESDVSSRMATFEYLSESNTSEKFRSSISCAKAPTFSSAKSLSSTSISSLKSGGDNFIAAQQVFMERLKRMGKWVDKKPADTSTGLSTSFYTYNEDLSSELDLSSWPDDRYSKFGTPPPQQKQSKFKSIAAPSPSTLPTPSIFISKPPTYNVSEKKSSVDYDVIPESEFNEAVDAASGALYSKSKNNQSKDSHIDTFSKSEASSSLISEGYNSSKSNHLVYYDKPLITYSTSLATSNEDAASDLETTKLMNMLLKQLNKNQHEAKESLSGLATNATISPPTRNLQISTGFAQGGNNSKLPHLTQATEASPNLIIARDSENSSSSSNSIHLQSYFSDMNLSSNSESRIMIPLNNL